MLSLKFFLTVTAKPGVKLGECPTSSIRRLAVPKETTFDGLFKVMTQCLLGRVGRSDAVIVAFEVSYVDEDGDNVFVGSEPEWEEAVAKNSASVLKLSVNAVISLVTDGEHDASDEDTTTEEVTTPVPASERAEHCPEQQESTPSDEQTPTAPLPAAPGPCVQGTLQLPQQALTAPIPAAPGQSPSVQQQQVAPMLALLSVLCDCDAEAELASMSPVARLSALVERRLDGENADIQINGNAVRRQVHVRSVALLDEGKHQEAADLLQAGVKVYPRDGTMMYNYACALALIKKDTATVVGVLRRAIDCGYDKFEFIRRDKDLASVHNSAELRQLLVEHVGEPAMKLMDMFPHLSLADATQLLGKFDGNIRAATMHLLEEESF